MNFIKKLLLIAVACVCPLMGMQQQMSVRQALKVFGFATGTITNVQMKARYHELARTWHPDKVQDKNATAKMQEINNAYEILQKKNYPLDVEKTLKEPEFATSPFSSYSTPDENIFKQRYSRNQFFAEDILFVEAVKACNYAEVEKLLNKKNKDLANILFNGNSILYVALENYLAGKKDAIKIIQLLLLHGAGPNAAYLNYNKSPIEYCTPLGFILKCDGIKNSIDLVPVIKLLLRYKADVNAFCDSEDGLTPLCSAILHNHSLAVVELLLQNGADPKKLSNPKPRLWNYPTTPLIHVMWREQKKDQVALINMLLHYGADVNVYTTWGTALRSAVNVKASAEVIHTLLNAGARIFTAHGAAFDRRSDAADIIFLEQFGKRQAIKRALLQKQVDQNLAVIQQQHQEQNKDMNMLNRYYNSWFHYSTNNSGHVKEFIAAVDQGNVEKIALILQSNPKFANVRSSESYNPSLPLVRLQCSYKVSKEQMLKIAKLLVSYGADLDATETHKNWEGYHASALSEALAHRSNDLIRFFLQSGARVDNVYTNCLHRFCIGKEIADILEEELNGPMPAPLSKL